MNTELSNILSELVWHAGYDGPGVREIAHATHTHERTVYSYLEGDRKPSFSWIAEVSRYLCEVHADYRIARVMLPDGAVVMVPDAHADTRDDELFELAELYGSLIHALRAGDNSAAMRALDLTIQTAAQLRAEIGGVK